MNDEQVTLVSEKQTIEMALLQLGERVMNSAVLSKLIAPGSNWLSAVHQALDLFEEPRNLSQLWVWARFVWAFGKRDEWRADAALDQLFAPVTAMRELNSQLRALPRWSRAKRRKLERQIIAEGYKLARCVIEASDNDQAWSDRQDFLQYRGRK